MCALNVVKGMNLSMNDLLEKDNINIENIIYEIRGKQVMLDSDLAKLYNCVNGTKAINLAVRRNLDRFPNDFYFQLTEIEFENLKFQFETSSQNTHGGVRKLPYVFIEQGVAMLSSVLRTDIASKVSIDIMRAFVAMRKYVSNDLIEQKYINNMFIKHDNDIKILQETFNKLESKEKINEIYFYGQIYDAYSKIMGIMSKTKKELIVIDAYVDRSFLDMIRNFNFKVILITKENNKLTKLDISKYREEYNNLTIIYDNTFHDRYFILDKDIIYHCGTSINHAGSRTFSINKLEDEIVKKALINRISQML